uniref:NACHT domain-containing protein n=1 Tax=Entomoneis paludosa TaxID=265537 RepID=A0A7S2Y1W9_9STRA
MGGRQRNRTFANQRRETAGVQELLEMAISLVIRFASRFYETTNQSNGKVLKQSRGEDTADTVLLVEQVCALEAARPIAVREGILRVLVEWIRGSPEEKDGGNKMKSAAVLALRHLTSIKDKYMAGWIHSQMVSSGALPAIVALTNDIHLTYPVRLAIAQILSSLCIAPHTRAAVVEADCIHFLIDLLYEHGASEELAMFAGQALLQLAAGAIQRAGTLGTNDKELLGFSSRERHDRILNDIVARGAIASFVAIALDKRGKLRMIAIETLGVLSEDVSPNRGARLQLCEDGAALALGRTMLDCMRRVDDAGGIKFGDEDLEQLYQALCALSNILDPNYNYEGALSRSTSNPDAGDTPRPKSLLVNSCLQAIESGGLKSMLRLASFPVVENRLAQLVEETCHSLSLLSPYLLSTEIASNGLAGWADQVLEVFCYIVQNLTAGESDSDDFIDNMDLHVSVLQGIGALAKSAPLKVRIVDRILPYLIRAKNSRDNTSVSNSASHAFQSLEFAEDEVAVQTAGNNANLLSDWFCMQRLFVIQAMARAEIRQHLVETWGEAVSQSNDPGYPKLSRRISDRSRGDISYASFSSEFPHFGGDETSEKETQSIIQEYEYMFGESATRALSNAPSLDRATSTKSTDGLLSQQVYPLDSSQSETSWILDHARALRDDSSNECGGLSNHVEDLLNRCFPSSLLREREIPTRVIKLDSSYNFRAILMPQRRYFSFRREGLLLSRLCDKESAALSDPSDAHWTLNFTNSSFAGEFPESLVQALYMCPTICGLSFVGNNHGSGDSELGMERTSSMQAKSGGAEGGGLLANLVGSLPPWIGNLTFERVLDDRDMKALVAVLETLGRLTGGRGLLTQSFVAKSSPGTRATGSDVQAQGRFSFFAVRHSPELSSVAWKSFFNLIGEPHGSRRNEKRPLSTLRSLDLSGNGLGDELCASVLEIIHDKDSGCQIEELDLSGNRIGAGAQVLDVLSYYAQAHRSSKLSGVKVRGGIWQAPLHTLCLSMNGLNQGKAWLEIVAMLKRDTLALTSLNLSSNGLALKEDDYDSDIIVSSLLKNTSLQTLDLSGNEFHSRTIDDMLGQLENVAGDKGLALVHLADNTPPLNDRQLHQLDEISRSSRNIMMQRLNAEKEEKKKAQELERDASVRFLGGDSTRTMTIDDRSETHQEASPDRQEAMPPEEPSADNKITVLFSAPLVFKDSSEALRPFAKLDFEMERELLWQCLKEASRDIELSFDSATHDRLLATVSKRCSCLHYSGHGNEHYLPFEDGKGGPNWFEVEDIKKLIGAQEGSVPFRFVFVSACFSGLAGETFAAAGVPHVVCCRQEFELKDAAALAFTRQFYLALAVGHTVKESFEVGCKAVRATPNLRDAEQEMEKFILLPKDGNHDVPIFDAKPVLQWPRSLHGSASLRGSRFKAKVAGNARFGELGVRNMIQDDPSPSPPQFFLGREVDMYIVLNLLLVKRLVSVVGEVGVGRSSLVCALCHYINERKTTMNQVKHIYFVKAKQGRSKQNRVRALVQRLLKKLVESDIVNVEDVDKEADIETLFDIVCRSLKNEKAVIVFDRTDLLEDSDEGNEFPMLLSNLFRETRNVRVLLTARETLGIPSIGGHVEHYYRLGPLTFANSVRLFSSLCPYMHTPSDRRRLYNKMVANLDEAELLPTDPGISSTVKKQFELIGNGIPSNIEKAAYTISKDVLMSLLRTDDNGD